jgi:hypothetical protein
MLFTAYDAFAFADYTASTGDRLKSLAGAAFWRPGSEASRRYDTLGSVSALGHVTEGGMCAVCGGARSRPKCACDHSVDDVPADQLVVDEVVTSGGARTRRARVLDVVDDQDHEHDEADRGSAGLSEAAAGRAPASGQSRGLPVSAPIVRTPLGRRAASD